ncbi:MAG TPA: ABC transporter ATP-binding protein, partial [Anaerolineales bacterium]|nr:ABC transporter ATP-binding protein [Anaerolineales bacterium]
MQTSPVLSVRSLTVSYRVGKGYAPAIREIDLDLLPGEKCGVVGESGSGKTTFALAILGYLPENARVDQGSILLDGKDLIGLNRSELRKFWGKKLAFVPQDSSSSLNPSLRIERQMVELLQVQLGLNAKDGRVRAAELLESVQIRDAERILRSYPHQISGGMKQRVLISLALSTEPLLLILDEPTTGLDVTTQAAVIELLRSLVQTRRTAVLYVSHNLGVVGRLCDRVAVMYSGELVETGPVEGLFGRQLHPYTAGLMASIPRLQPGSREAKFVSMEGQIGPLGERPSGCVFEPRCPIAVSLCQTRPPLYPAGVARESRCYRWDEISAGTVLPVSLPAVRSSSMELPPGEEILVLNNLSVRFPFARGVRELLHGTPPQYIDAVKDINLAIEGGSTLGLVGESGAGKTSLARAIAGLSEGVDGEMEFFSLPLPPELNRRGLETLRKLQMVFQNPDEALNPYIQVGESLRRPLVTLLGKTGDEADRMTADLLEAVRLPRSYATRLPGQLSGGERQRVAIARAFASNPAFLIFDEPVSSLDVSIQASILNLIGDLNQQHRTSQIFISHDLAVVSAISDRIAVIYSGRLMEISPAEALLSPPFNPYTEVLLSSLPEVGGRAGISPMNAGLEITESSPSGLGCPFYGRCLRSPGEICKDVTPP